MFIDDAIQDKEDQNQVVGNLKSISMASSKLLLAAKALSADPGAPNAKNQLAAAARLESQSIIKNYLLLSLAESCPASLANDLVLIHLFIITTGILALFIDR